MLTALRGSRQCLRHLGGVRLTWAAPGIAVDQEYGAGTAAVEICCTSHHCAAGIPFLDVGARLDEQLPQIIEALTRQGYFTTTGWLGSTINAAMRSDAVRLRRTEQKFTQSLSIATDGVPFAKKGVFSAELDGALCCCWCRELSGWCRTRVGGGTSSTCLHQGINELYTCARQHRVCTRGTAGALRQSVWH